MPRVDTWAVIPASRTRSYRISYPDLRQAADGLQAWGRLCRSGLAYSPRGLQLELADARDEVIATRTTYGFPSLRRARRCAFYSIATKWQVLSGQHLHLCAIPYFRSSTPCFERRADDRH